MSLFNLKIDNKEYSYLNSISIDGRNFIAFTDPDSIYISELTEENGSLNLKEVNDELKYKVKELLGL